MYIHDTYIAFESHLKLKFHWLNRWWARALQQNIKHLARIVADTYLRAAIVCNL